jgi:hypothetical protein
MSIDKELRYKIKDFQLNTKKNKEGLRVKNYNIWTILLIIVVVIIIGPHVLKFAFTVIFILLVVGLILFILKKSNNGNKYNKMDRMFMNGETKATELHNKYDFTFSNAVLDCTELPVPLQDKNIKIDVTFSKCVIKINPDVPAIIRIDTSFSNVRLPSNNSITFGEESYATRGYRRGLPCYYIQLDVSFSDVNIIEI